jgi:spore germination cell wall hydrolase CwlJ-like protein
MRNLIPKWLIGFAFLYVILQIITLELPERDRGDEMPRLFSHGSIENIVLQNETIYSVDINKYKMPHEDATKQESIVCLAKNAYFEARNQSVLSQIAVSQVVMNRVQSPDFPNTVCGVVYEAQLSKWYKDKMDKEVPLKHKCQFSWYCDGKADIITDVQSYKIALAVAHQVLSKYTMHDVTDGALFYHAYYVKPRWAREKIKTVVHEDHIFYRERN